MLGMLHRHPDFPSRWVRPRNVDVWLPPGYAQGGRRFPVIYMHDGQNLFDPGISYGGVDWGMDEAVVDLVSRCGGYEAMVVGIWNTDRRWQEYMPQKALRSQEPLRSLHGQPLKDDLAGEFGGEVVSDDYLRFLVQEVKPFVDRTYRTLDGQSHTYVMGSSMGGLISLYALCEYPQVFGGAGCLSTHWPAGEGIVIDYLPGALPRPGAHKVYFDYGTETLDASYEQYQVRVDQVMRVAGYSRGVDWLTLKFAGAEHSERAWRARVQIPLAFLLGEGPAAL